ncbi:unnamed protein product [Effrenium voratum]|nr:unnamed protein product [Effrenium voratum]
MHQVASINQILRQEHQAQQELQEEQSRLEQRQEQLVSLLQEAAAAEDDERGAALIKALAQENSNLRSLLFPSNGPDITDSPRKALSSRASRSSEDRRFASPESPMSPIDFPFRTDDLPLPPLPPLPPMPPPSPPSQHREVR